MSDNELNNNEFEIDESGFLDEESSILTDLELSSSELNNSESSGSMQNDNKSRIFRCFLASAIGLSLVGLVVGVAYYSRQGPGSLDMSEQLQNPNSVIHSEGPIQSIENDKPIETENIKIQDTSQSELEKMREEYQFQLNDLKEKYSKRFDEIKAISESNSTALDNIPNVSGLSNIRDLLMDTKLTLDGISKTQKEQQQQLDKLQAKLKKLSKNAGWHHNRLRKLENSKSQSIEISKAVSTTSTKPKSLTVAKKAQLTQSRRVEFELQTYWSVKAASNDLAFIKDTRNGQTLRVRRGFDVPDCGHVTDIVPEKQQVLTTKCVISD